MDKLASYRKYRWSSWPQIHKRISLNLHGLDTQYIVMCPHYSAAVLSLSHFRLETLTRLESIITNILGVCFKSLRSRELNRFTNYYYQWKLDLPYLHLWPIPDGLFSMWAYKVSQRLHIEHHSRWGSTQSPVDFVDLSDETYLFRKYCLRKESSCFL